MTASTTDNQVPLKLTHGRNEVIDISITTDPAECTLSVEYADGTWDVVYQGGRFARQFSGSTLVGSDFHIVPPRGGWSAPFSVRTNEAPPAGPAGPDLQPLLYSPRAAWALDSTAVGGLVVDRSGAGYALADPPMKIGADLRAGHTAVFGNLMGLADSGQDPDFRFAASDFTVILRYALRIGNSEEYLVGSTVGTSGLNSSWELWSTDAGALVYKSGGYGGNQGTTNPAFAPLNSGVWSVVSLRRDAARTSVRLGINDSFITRSVVATTPHPACVLRFGGLQSAPFVRGGLSDCVIWPSYLTDAQVVAQYKVMLGVA